MNDVSFAPDGTLYVTDTGPDSSSADATDRQAIYHFARAGDPVNIMRDTDLGGPDGIVAADTMVVYATFKSNQVIRVSHSGARTTIATLPGGKVDGLRELPHGSYVVTSWDAKTVYHLMPDGTLTPIATGITSPAGVAYNIKRDQVAITSMQTGRMYIVALR
jgi:sugar lactone lactonase YvrE